MKHSDKVGHLAQQSRTLAPWQLPPGVSRSLWEYAHDPAIAREDATHLAGSSLIALDERLIHEWFAAPGPLVDLGCGTGRLLVAFAERGFPVLGVDLAPESLRVAQEAARAKGVEVGLLRANLCELDGLPDGDFDYALLMFGTLGMVSGPANRLRVLQQARRLLKPGGQLALHAHNVWHHLFHPASRPWLIGDRLKALLGNPTAGDTERDYRGIPGMFHHAFSQRELRHLLDAAGFKIEEQIPLATGSGGELFHPRWLKAFRSHGWFVRARRG